MRERAEQSADLARREEIATLMRDAIAEVMLKAVYAGIPRDLRMRGSGSFTRFGGGNGAETVLDGQHPGAKIAGGSTEPCASPPGRDRSDIRFGRVDGLDKSEPACPRCAPRRRCLRRRANLIKETGMNDQLAEIEERLSIAQENVRQLTEQAAAYSGTKDEELAAERIKDQEDEIARLTKLRAELTGAAAPRV
jgi:hypothetical protein